MHGLSQFSLASTALIAMTALAACSSSPSSPACDDYSPGPSFNANSPTVSFTNDVMPIFATSCAFGTCHGSAFDGANGVYLGGSDPSKIYQAIVNVPADELPTKAYVKPGDPRESYLMRKLDGSNCALNGQCKGGDCGFSMPRGDDILPLETRDTVRRWIAQGAKKE
jgi:hypothetical protein